MKRDRAVYILQNIKFNDLGPSWGQIFLRLCSFDICFKQNKSHQKSFNNHSTNFLYTYNKGTFLLCCQHIHLSETYSRINLHKLD